MIRGAGTEWSRFRASDEEALTPFTPLRGDYANGPAGLDRRGHLQPGTEGTRLRVIDPMRSTDFHGVADTVRAAGRYGDSELIHVSPREREVLRRMFGPETRNPATGLPEHWLEELMSSIGDWFGGGEAAGVAELGSDAFMDAGDLGGEVFSSGAGDAFMDVGDLGGLAEAGSSLDLEDLSRGAAMLNQSGLDQWGKEIPIPEAKPPAPEGYLSKLATATRLASSAGTDKKAKEPGFLERNKTPLLLGGGALLLASILNRATQSKAPGFQPVSTTPRAPISLAVRPQAATGLAPGASYGGGPEGAFFRAMAGGGGVRGPGTGRSDDVPAMLSDGEHVVDAETVSLLGDGSNSAGQRKLGKMVKRVREHKGKALRRGSFTPAARDPLSYLGRQGGR